MLKIGITGGMGAGKSTISRLFKEKHGIPVYDSDSEVKRLLNSNYDLRALVTNLLGPTAYFGKHDNSINKEYIASKIFEDSSLRKKMQDIIRPFLWEDFEFWCNDEKDNGAPYVIFESAILIESELTDEFDKIIVVMADEDIRIKRLTEKRNVDEDEAKRRLLTQTTDAKRLEKADFIIRNDKNLIHTPDSHWEDFIKESEEYNVRGIHGVIQKRNEIIAERIAQIDHKIKYISYGSTVNKG